MSVWHSWENPDGSRDEDYGRPPGRATERAELERLGYLPAEVAQQILADEEEEE